jgi:hypothetical protein
MENFYLILPVLHALLLFLFIYQQIITNKFFNESDKSKREIRELNDSIIKEYRTILVTLLEKMSIEYPCDSDDKSNNETGNPDY